jgi:hypothetical protein
MMRKTIMLATPTPFLNRFCHSPVKHIWLDSRNTVLPKARNRSKHTYHRVLNLASDTLNTKHDERGDCTERNSAPL